MKEWERTLNDFSNAKDYDKPNKQMKEYKCTPTDFLGRIGPEFPSVKFRKKRFDLNLIGENIIGVVNGKKYVCVINHIEFPSHTQMFEIGATILSEVSEPLEPEKPIDKVTVELLDISLRMCGIEIHKSVLDKVIDVVELLEEKGGKATVDDFEDLKASWK